MNFWNVLQAGLVWFVCTAITYRRDWELIQSDFIQRKSRPGGTFDSEDAAKRQQW